MPEALGDMLSFVIAAYNEEALLGGTLAALYAAARASGHPFEVVVVDDAFTDRTAVIAREHGARVVLVNHRQIAATRNVGAKKVPSPSVERLGRDDPSLHVGIWYF